VPEGDTVLRAARRIEAALLDREILEVRTPQARHRYERWPERLRGKRLRAVETRGKHMLLRFDGELAIHSHLRMSGAWHVYPRGAQWRRSPRSAWLVLGTQDQEVVQFNGPVLELSRTGWRLRDPRLTGLGPDILSPSFEISDGVRGLRSGDPTRGIGEALLDQRRLAGVGNAHKNEGLFAAGIDPWRRVHELSDDELAGVVERTRARMSAALEPGRRWPRRIYRRAGFPCPTCGTTVRSRGQGDDNRTTYWCPSCQR
jgi:endonuclease-8